METKRMAKSFFIVTIVAMLALPIGLSAMGIGYGPSVNGVDPIQLVVFGPSVVHDSFFVYRGTEPTVLQLIAKTGPPSRYDPWVFYDNDVPDYGRVYYYKVVLTGGASYQRAIVSELPAPKNVSGRLQPDGNIIWTWEPSRLYNGSFATEYFVYDTTAKYLGGVFTNSWVGKNRAIKVRAYYYGSPDNEIASGSSGFSLGIVLTTRYFLKQNYPNPFNPVTTISFYLAEPSTVSLKIFDMLGQEIATLINDEYKSAGDYSVSWNAAHLSSGNYFYQLESGNKVVLQKIMTLLK